MYVHSLASDTRATFITDLVMILQGGMSDKEAEIRASLARLDDAFDSNQPLTSEDISVLRRQLEDSHALVRESQDRSKQVSEENEILVRRREELEHRLAGLETEYEELLGRSFFELVPSCLG